MCLILTSLFFQGVKEHKCRICGREFTLLANMKRHVLIHTNIRAYQCHMCFKSFVQKQTLKAHMIVHSEIKPYKCKVGRDLTPTPLSFFLQVNHVGFFWSWGPHKKHIKKQLMQSISVDLTNGPQSYRYKLNITYKPINLTGLNKAKMCTGLIFVNETTRQ